MSGRNRLICARDFIDGRLRMRRLHGREAEQGANQNAHGIAHGDTIVAADSLDLISVNKSCRSNA
jgi:hypothetical protein